MVTANVNIRVATFEDGTEVVRVHGCPYCGRWTMSTAEESRLYPYHEQHCEFKRELMPMRFAHVDSKDWGGTFEGMLVLKLLPEGVDPMTWRPS